MSQNYPAKLYILGGIDKVEIGSFTIEPGKNKNIGPFVSVPNIRTILEEARNDKEYTFTLVVKINAFPNISYSFQYVFTPIKCPDEDFGARKVIEVDLWKKVKDNICCKCYSQPYEGSEIIWDGKRCSKNGTTC